MNLAEGWTHQAGGRQVSIDDVLPAKAKRVAVETGRSLSSVIDDALKGR